MNLEGECNCFVYLLLGETVAGHPLGDFCHHLVICGGNVEPVYYPPQLPKRKYLFHMWLPRIPKAGLFIFPLITGFPILSSGQPRLIGGAVVLPTH